MMENDPIRNQGTENAGARTDGIQPAGAHLALAQSLRAMSEAQEAGHEGWAVVSKRAELAVRQVGMSVTRLLFQPDLRLRDPERDEPLQVLNCSMDDQGNWRVSTMGLVTRQVRAYMLDDLHVDGPVAEAVKAAVQEAMRLLIEDSIGKAVGEGQLSGLPTFERLHLLATIQATTPDELVDQQWDTLGDGVRGVHTPTGDHWRSITREQLSDAMLAAALHALDRKYGDTQDDATAEDQLTVTQPPPLGPPCTKAPEGWRCVQGDGHKGPCVTTPNGADPLGDGSDYGLTPLEQAIEATSEQLVQQPDSETVHNLQPHPGYVMDGSGGCKPDPLAGVCPTCTKPKHLCACGPVDC